MGGGASAQTQTVVQQELQKPLDASDLSAKTFKVEIVRLRKLLADLSQTRTRGLQGMACDSKASRQNQQDKVVAKHLNEYFQYMSSYRLPNNVKLYYNILPLEEEARLEMLTLMKTDVRSNACKLLKLFGTQMKKSGTSLSDILARMEWPNLARTREPASYSNLSSTDAEEVMQHVIWVSMGSSSTQIYTHGEPAMGFYVGLTSKTFCNDTKQLFVCLQAWQKKHPQRIVYVMNAGGYMPMCVAQKHLPWILSPRMYSLHHVADHLGLLGLERDIPPSETCLAAATKLGACWQLVAFIQHFCKCLPSVFFENRARLKHIASELKNATLREKHPAEVELEEAIGDIQLNNNWSSSLCDVLPPDVSVVVDFGGGGPRLARVQRGERSDGSSSAQIVEWKTRRVDAEESTVVHRRYNFSSKNHTIGKIRECAKALGCGNAKTWRDEDGLSGMLVWLSRVAKEEVEPGTAIFMHQTGLLRQEYFRTKGMV